MLNQDFSVKERNITSFQIGYCTKILSCVGGRLGFLIDMEGVGGRLKISN